MITFDKSLMLLLNTNTIKKKRTKTKNMSENIHDIFCAQSLLHKFQ